MTSISLILSFLLGFAPEAPAGAARAIRETGGEPGARAALVTKPPIPEPLKKRPRPRPRRSAAGGTA